MESLPEDIFLIIVKKIAAFGAHDLFRFEIISTYHQKLACENAVLRALPRNCLWYLTDHWRSAGKRKFMQQISRSGHAIYIVVLAAQMLQGDHPT